MANVLAVESSGEYKGYPIKVLFMSMGYRCGYVGLKEGHPLYGVSDNRIDIDCHGGLTFSDDNLYPYDQTDIWWLGFDCAHVYDLFDVDTLRKYKASENNIYYAERFNKSCLPGSELRTLEYVIDNCKKIINQLERIRRDIENDQRRNAAEDSRKD